MDTSQNMEGKMKSLFVLVFFLSTTAYSADTGLGADTEPGAVDDTAEVHQSADVMPLAMVPNTSCSILQGHGYDTRVDFMPFYGPVLNPPPFPGPVPVPGYPNLSNSVNVAVWIDKSSTPTLSAAIEIAGNYVPFPILCGANQVTFAPMVLNKTYRVGVYYKKSTLPLGQQVRIGWSYF